MRKLKRRRCASNRPLGRGGGGTDEEAEEKAVRLKQAPGEGGGGTFRAFRFHCSPCVVCMEPSVPHLHTVLNMNSVVKASRLDRRVGRSGLVSLASRQWLKRREK